MITAMYCDKCGSGVLADPARPYVRCIRCDNLTTAAVTRPTKPQFRPILERGRCEHCGKLTLLPNVNYCARCGRQSGRTNGGNRWKQRWPGAQHSPVYSPPTEGRTAARAGPSAPNVS